MDLQNLTVERLRLRVRNLEALYLELLDHQDEATREESLRHYYAIWDHPFATDDE
jgi:hypothetical protein